MFNLNLKELSDIQKLLHERLTTPNVKFAQVLKNAFLGWLFFSNKGVSANSTVTEPEENSPEVSHKIKERIKVSNNLIMQYDNMKNKDNVAVMLAYIERCSELDDSVACFRAGVKLYVSTFKNPSLTFTVDGKQLPATTHFKKKGIESIEKAILLDPDNPLYYTYLGLTYLDFGNEQEGYAALAYAYKLNREVAGIVVALQGATPYALIRQYSDVEDILNPDRPEKYFKSEAIRAGEHLLSKRVNNLILHEEEQEAMRNAQQQII